jgi:hypothetical protein
MMMALWSVIVAALHKENCYTVDKMEALYHGCFLFVFCCLYIVTKTNVGTNHIDGKNIIVDVNGNGVTVRHDGFVERMETIHRRENRERPHNVVILCFRCKKLKK